MTPLCRVIHYTIILIVWNIKVSQSFQGKFIVNFSDAVARIDRIESGSPAKVSYGDRGNLSVPQKFDPLKVQALILRPFNGWAYLKNSTRFFPMKPEGKLNAEYDGFNSSMALSDNKLENGFFEERGLMIDRGFWRFLKRDTDSRFIIFNEYIVGEVFEPVSLFNQNSTSITGWNFVQMFEWETDFFACFKTSNKTLVVLRLKPFERPNYEAVGTFISSFYLDITLNSSVYFLPSYHEPIMYYSREERDGGIVFHTLKLKDVLARTEEGFQKCDDGKGRFPDDFFKLQYYVGNYSKVFWPASETGSCKIQIPLFYYENFQPCFTIGPDVVKSSIDTYLVGLDFKQKY